MDPASDWLAARTPAAPNELSAWLTTPGGESDGQRNLDGPADSIPEALLRAGLLHLDDALARPGRDREAAYRLLAADALITYCCEGASEAADIRCELRDILGRVSSGRSVE